MKGFAFDMMYGLISLCVLIIVIWAVTNVVYDIDDSPIFTGTTQGNNTVGYMKDSTNIWQGAVLALAVAIGVGAMVTAFFSQSHPMAFVAMIFFNIVMYFVLGVLSNGFESMLVGQGMATTSNLLPVALTVVRNIPIFGVVFGFLISIMMALRRN